MEYAFSIHQLFIVCYCNHGFLYVYIIKNLPYSATPQLMWVRYRKYPNTNYWNEPT
jgi:hypothetical protein